MYIISIPRKYGLPGQVLQLSCLQAGREVCLLEQGCIAWVATEEQPTITISSCVVASCEIQVQERHQLHRPIGPKIRTQAAKIRGQVEQ